MNSGFLLEFIPAKAGVGKTHHVVIPVSTGIQRFDRNWIPAFAGMTYSRRIDKIINRYYYLAKMKYYYVYILSSKRNGTLYTGVTSNLIKRVYEHKNDLVDGFTKKYKVHNLVWYEIHDTVISAISREKQIKKWRRQWKLELIEKENPKWIDLYDDICSIN